MPQDTLLILLGLTSFMFHSSRSLKPLSRCHAIASEYSQVGLDPLLFNFESILYHVNAPLLGTIDGDIEIDTVQYFVYNKCQIMIYMVSRDVWLPEYFINMFQRLDVDSISIVCKFNQSTGDIEDPIPLVLKLLRQQSVLVSNDVPDWWYEGNRAIIAFEIKALPREINSTFVCKTEFSHENVDVILNATATITKAGCPIGRYGKNCTNLCYCIQPDQSCHALYGQPCYDQCPKDMRREGSYCEEVPSTTQAFVTTNQINPESDIGPEYANAGADDKDPSIASRKDSANNHSLVSLYMCLVPAIFALMISVDNRVV